MPVRYKPRNFCVFLSVMVSSLWMAAIPFPDLRSATITKAPDTKLLNKDFLRIRRKISDQAERLTRESPPFCWDIGPRRPCSLSRWGNWHQYESGSSCSFSGPLGTSSGTNLAIPRKESFSRLCEREHQQVLARIDFPKQDQPRTETF